MIIIRKAEELKLIQVYIKETVLIDTKSPKVRIEILMSGTKIKGEGNHDRKWEENHDLFCVFFSISAKSLPSFTSLRAT